MILNAELTTVSSAAQLLGVSRVLKLRRNAIYKERPMTMRAGRTG